MKRCAFLTMEDLSGFFVDDQLVYEPMARLGWQVEAVPWTRTARWSEFDAVVIRSTWDYTERPAEFLETLAEIERSGAPLFNDVALVRWNLDKRYLRDLEGRGVPIVPTAWRDGLGRGELAGLFDDVGAAEMVVKPTIGAGANGAYRLRRAELTRELADEVEGYYTARRLMAQPFLQSIVDEGEYSLIYIGGEYSHAVQKVPQRGDYRVQEEHGSAIRPVAAEGSLRAAADRVMGALRELDASRRRATQLQEARPSMTAALYARVDLARDHRGEGFWLMELELVEPSLYLRMDEEAAERLARAIAKSE